ncbi:MAG: hypothetical protein LBS54_08660 [Dysgonamonadaceae bacterium]|nr:hypothetical protein [Dysgonamonadaceae bacterium]
MGTIRQGILGGFSGKVGTVIVSGWKYCASESNAKLVLTLPSAAENHASKSTLPNSHKAV